MISEFEQRLADVLGERLPPPFKGRAYVASAPSNGPDPAVTVRVATAVALESGMGGEALQTVPGAAAPRRTVRLACTVEIAVISGAMPVRPQQMQGADAVLYLLDAPDIRNGAALAGGAADPGFLIRSMRFVELDTPPTLLPSGDVQEQAILRFNAEGLFWPVGMPGETGREIEQIRVRGALAPLRLELPTTKIIAGGAPVALVLHVRDITRPAGAPPGTFASLALYLIGSGGGPGGGTLVGAVNGVLLADVHDGVVEFAYQPPADPGRLWLVVALDNGEQGIGLELERFQLKVEEAP